MRAFTRILPVLALVSLFIAFPARANDACPVYQAVFKPHPSYYTATERLLDYRLTVAPPPEGKKGLDRWHDFIIHVHDAADQTELSRYRMSLAFPFGGIIPTIDGARFYPANADFSRNGNYEIAPHALILPNFGTRFRHADWEKSPRITFLTAAKTPPGPETPELWMFEKCLSASKD